MRRIVVFLFIGMAFLTGCRSVVVDLQDFVDLDRVYFPLYLFAQANQAVQSEKALFQFSQRWAVFKSKYQMDKRWRPTIKQIDATLVSANATLVSSGKPQLILPGLGEVQMSLIKSRQEMRIPYYLDQVVMCQLPLSYIMDIVNGRGPELPYSPTEIGRLERALLQLKNKWDAIDLVQFDPILFGFSTEKNSLRQHYLASGKAAIISLYQVLSTGEAPKSRELYDQCRDLAIINAYLLQLFGDFKASQSTVFAPGINKKSP